MTVTRSKLVSEGYSFDFFQALRLLEDSEPDRIRIGYTGPFNQEAVRVRPGKDLAFPAGDIESIEYVADADKWLVTENFMGLYGPNAPLPIYFSTMIAQNYSDSDPLRSFLDIFNHRLISLYYRAWKKYRIGFDPSAGDSVSLALQMMLGHDADEERPPWPVPPHRLVRYAGLLAGGSRSASGLETLLEDFFGLEKVCVTDFDTKRIRLSEQQKTRIGEGAQNNVLGENVILGASVEDVTGQFRLTLGPLSRRVFDRFLPGQESYEKLIFLVHLYTRRQLDFTLELLLSGKDVSPAMVTSKYKLNPLGLACWLDGPKNETVSVIFPVDQQ